MRCLGCLIIYSAYSSLCNLCALCASVVGPHHRGTENTEKAQRKLFLFLLLLRLLFRCIGRFGCWSRFFRFGNDFVLIQPGGARRVGQSLDAAVIKVATPIEDNLLDSFGERTLGNCLTDAASSIKIAAAVTAQIFFRRRSRNQCLALPVVDNLRINVVQAAIDREPRLLCIALYLPANPRMNRGSNFCSACV